jgi:hypothetical protein
MINSNRRFFFALLLLTAFCCTGSAAAGQDDAKCRQLDQPVSGAQQKYSLVAEAHGALFFADLTCGVQHRNHELCAMEMISFDASARVYDYDTLAELEMAKAFFVVGEKSDDAQPVVAFGTKEAAERFIAASGKGKIVDYQELLQWAQ